MWYIFSYICIYTNLLIICFSNISLGYSLGEVPTFNAEQCIIPKPNLHLDTLIPNIIGSNSMHEMLRWRTSQPRNGAWRMKVHREFTPGFACSSDRPKEVASGWVLNYNDVAPPKRIWFFGNITWKRLDIAPTWEITWPCRFTVPNTGAADNSPDDL